MARRKIRDFEQVRDIVRPEDPLTNIVYPLIHTAVAALLFGTVVAMLTVVWEGGTEYISIACGVLAGSALALVLWLAWLARRYALLWRIEKLLGADLDHDGWVGDPNVKRRT